MATITSSYSPIRDGDSIAIEKDEGIDNITPYPVLSAVPGINQIDPKNQKKGVAGVERLFVAGFFDLTTLEVSQERSESMTELVRNFQLSGRIIVGGVILGPYACSIEFITPTGLSVYVMIIETDYPRAAIALNDGTIQLLRMASASEGIGLTWIRDGALVIRQGDSMRYIKIDDDSRNELARRNPTGGWDVLYSTTFNPETTIVTYCGEGPYSLTISEIE